MCTSVCEVVRIKYGRVLDNNDQYAVPKMIWETTNMLNIINDENLVNKTLNRSYKNAVYVHSCLSSITYSYDDV